MKTFFKVVGIIAVFCLIVVALGCLWYSFNKDSETGQKIQAIIEPQTGVALEEARVNRVIDGDTLEVNIAGTNSKVRLIGVDCPESVNPDESKNCEEGVEASNYTKAHFYKGQQVWLEKDVSDVDLYGRKLRYVWLLDPTAQLATGTVYTSYIKDNMLQGNLLRDGHATAKSYPPDTKYESDFAEIEKNN